MKKILKTTVAALAITVMFAACKGKSSESGAADSAATDTAVTTTADTAIADSGIAASHNEGKGGVTASDTVGKADSTKK